VVNATSRWIASSCRGTADRPARPRPTGATGTHVVATTMTTSPFAAPMTGGTVDVLYDPADDQSVIIEAQGRQSGRL
jgi:hypothetical protein